MTACMERAICEALKTQLETITWVKKVEYENIHVILSDVKDHELPLLQFYDNGADIKHERGRLDTGWNLAVELILKSTEAGTVAQGDLLDKKNDIELCIGSNVDLKIPGILHFIYQRWVTDTHSSKPFFIARLEFKVQFYKTFVN